MATNDHGVCPDFFKVHLGDLTSENMQFPPAFVKYLPQPLPPSVVLLSYGGVSWTINLTRIDNDVFFGNGWKKFVKDNDLVYGDFLVFKYDGSRAFGVSIYGRSGCKEGRAGTKVEEISDDEEEDEVEKDSGSNDVDDESSSFYSLGNDNETEDECELETPGKKRSRGFHGRENKGGHPFEANGSSVKRYRATIDPVAKYLQDPLNPYIIVRLQKRIYELRISSKTVKDHCLKFGKFAHFIDPHGELRGEITIWSHDQRVCIRGWHRVCRRNKLKSSDKIICEFLRNGRRVEFIRVHIIRNGFRSA